MIYGLFFLFILNMLMYETDTGGILVNIVGLKKGLWNNYNITDENCNTCFCCTKKVLKYIYTIVFKKLLNDNMELYINIMSNLDKTYFYILPNDKYIRKYYIRRGDNITENDVKISRKYGYYFGGIVVLNENYNNTKTMYGIDWIDTFLRGNGIAREMINELEWVLKITLIPINICLAYNYWKKYLYDTYRCDNIEKLKNRLLKWCNNMGDYYELAYNIEGYEKIFYDDINIEYNKEITTIKLIYDY